MSALQKVTLVRAVTPRWGLRPALEAAGLLLDCQTLDELTTVIARRIDYYNHEVALNDRLCSTAELCSGNSGPTVTGRTRLTNHVQLLGCTSKIIYRGRLDERPFVQL